MLYDLIIIGAGPAGLASAIFASRYKLKTLIIGERIGGLILEAHLIENYPGFESISGFELITRFKKHASALGIHPIQELVKKLSKNEYFEVSTDKKTYKAKALILCMGMSKQKLGIASEEKFLGKGLSYCAVCDAPLFKEKDVAVIGGADSAVSAALLLSKHAKNVYLIYRGKKLKAAPRLVEQLKGMTNIAVVLEKEVTAIKGKDVIEGIVLSDGSELPLAGLFIEIGSVPSSALAKQLGVRLNKDNFIIVNQAMETNIKGVFAAGDITTGSAGLRQIITACAEGAIAATSANAYVRGLK